MNLLIKNARIVDPYTKTDSEGDVHIKRGVIAAIKTGLSCPEGTECIDGAGMIMSPGLLDMHSHLREPGFEYKEDIESGTKAAAAGGFTGVACMPNLVPVTDTKAAVSYIKDRASAVSGGVRVYPIAAITINSDGRELCDYDALIESGAVAFSDDGKPVSEDAVMEAAARQIKGKSVLISHCEDFSVFSHGAVNEGEISRHMCVPGIPARAEENMVAREVRIARETGARIHIAHVSTEGSVMIIAQAKRDGVRITCETCPHYFALTENAVLHHLAQAKVNPPLRTEKDRFAILRGLYTGVIDAIATDHAPHTKEEKDRGIMTAPSGFSGFETALPLAITYLWKEHGGAMPLYAIVELMTAAPARILGLNRNGIEIGKTADLVLFDPRCAVTVDKNTFYSKGKNTPFDGARLYGKIHMTIANGNMAFRAR